MAKYRFSGAFSGTKLSHNKKKSSCSYKADSGPVWAGPEYGDAIVAHIRKQGWRAVKKTEQGVLFRKGRTTVEVSGSIHSKMTSWQTHSKTLTTGTATFEIRLAGS